MSETIENIKNFNIGDRVTSTHSILLDRGFRGVTGVIKTIVLDGRTWQYLIELDDGRELQCDDWHLERPQPQLNDNQKIVLERMKLVIGSQTSLIKSPSSLYNLLFIPTLSSIGELDYSIKDLTMLKEAVMSLNVQQEYEVLFVFSQWVKEQENK